MAKLVVLYIDDKTGDFERGFPVSLRIRENDRMVGQKVDAFLPANPQLLKYYQLWQAGYVSLVSSLHSSRRVKARKATNVSIPEIIAAGELLKSNINDWLNSGELMPVIHKLDEKLSRTDDILFVINTKNSYLQRLPWHFWDFFDSYGRAEVALSFPVSQRKLFKAKDKVKILAVFGDNQTSGSETVIGIDRDWELLQEHLKDAEFFTPMEQPTLEGLNTQLWETNPDIFYYGGHSAIEADGTTTTINFRSDEKIQIKDLIKALKRAGERGLQLAIFNSCEGLGIARELADSSIPQVIVMREAVPDEVARKFLEYFLRVFASGQPLYLAVREARERMWYLENKYPGATWLPMIFQNPAELPYTWRQIQGITINTQPNQQKQVNTQSKVENQSQNNQSKNVNVPPNIFCPNCGVQSAASARFCFRCGFEFHQTQLQSKRTDFSVIEEAQIQGSSKNRLENLIEKLKRSVFPALRKGVGNSTSQDTQFAGNIVLPYNINFQPGNLFNNRYLIIRILGDGGFGETFLAEDTQMPSARKCLIKKLKPITNNIKIYELVQERFQREAAILEELGNVCNQIPSLYAYFSENQEFYLVQEYIEGATLTQVLQQGLLSESDVKQILIDILPVLDYVHSKGIIHRDIKPENILIRYSDSKPVLIDFGAVKEIMHSVENSLKSSVVTAVIGTPGFMPPEQAMGRPVFSSDIYALGLTAIYLLTGKFPQVLVTDPQTGEILWCEKALGVSLEFKAVIDKSIAYHRSDRFANAKEMLEAIIRT